MENRRSYSISMLIFVATFTFFLTASCKKHAHKVPFFAFPKPTGSHAVGTMVEPGQPTVQYWYPAVGRVSDKPTRLLAKSIREMFIEEFELDSENEIKEELLQAIESEKATVKNKTKENVLAVIDEEIQEESEELEKFLKDLARVGQEGPLCGLLENKIEQIKKSIKDRQDLKSLGKNSR